MNELDPDLQSIFEELTKKINFLEINLKIIDNKLHFDVNHKLTNSFSYLHDKSPTTHEKQYCIVCQTHCANCY